MSPDLTGLWYNQRKKPVDIVSQGTMTFTVFHKLKT